MRLWHRDLDAATITANAIKSGCSSTGTGQLLSTVPDRGCGLESTRVGRSVTRASISQKTRIAVLHTVRGFALTDK